MKESTGTSATFFFVAVHINRFNLVCCVYLCAEMFFADGSGIAEHDGFHFTKFTARHIDVVVWTSLKDLRAKLVLAASIERLPTVVVNGEAFSCLVAFRKLSCASAPKIIL
jgi:hypothetical protein